MIKRLKEKNFIDVISLLEDYRDSYKDFYITKDKDRIFITSDKVGLIKKILKQECYGHIENGLLRGLLVIFREKGFRTYIKLLGDNNSLYKLLTYISWNVEQELWIKLKKDNPTLKLFLLKNRITNKPKFRFNFSGDRGLEVLLKRNRQRIKKSQKFFGEKDD